MVSYPKPFAIQLHYDSFVLSTPIYYLYYMNQTTLDTNNSTTNRLERIGFWLSLACAVHCLAMPVVITLLPFVGSTILADHETELYVMGGSWLLAGVLLYVDFKKHQNWLPLLLLMSSVGVKLLEVLVLGEDFEAIASPVSGVLIAVAYYFNWRYKKACACGHSH
jgi:hypothetical protein